MAESRSSIGARRGNVGDRASRRRASPRPAPVIKTTVPSSGKQLARNPFRLVIGRDWTTPHPMRRIIVTVLQGDAILVRNCRRFVLGGRRLGDVDRSARVLRGHGNPIQSRPTYTDRCRTSNLMKKLPFHKDALARLRSRRPPRRLLQKPFCRWCVAMTVPLAAFPDEPQSISGFTRIWGDVLLGCGPRRRGANGKQCSSPAPTAV